MRIEYDPNTDMLTIQLLPDPSVNTVGDYDTGLFVLYNEAGEVTELEIMDASERVEDIDELTFKVYEKVDLENLENEPNVIVEHYTSENAKTGENPAS